MFNFPRVYSMIQKNDNAKLSRYIWYVHRTPLSQVPSQSKTAQSSSFRFENPSTIHLVSDGNDVQKKHVFATSNWVDKPRKIPILGDSESWFLSQVKHLGFALSRSDFTWKSFQSSSNWCESTFQYWLSSGKLTRRIVKITHSLWVNQLVNYFYGHVQ